MIDYQLYITVIIIGQSLFIDLLIDLIDYLRLMI